MTELNLKICQELRVGGFNHLADAHLDNMVNASVVDGNQGYTRRKWTA